MLFYPVTEGIAKELSIWERAIIKGEIKSQTRQCFAIQRRGGKDVGVTYQGFWQRVLKQYVKEGYLPTIHDERTANTEKGYPEPALDKMYGFRFSQEDLLIKGMNANRSGLLGAPTRYGKCLTAGTKVLMYDYTIKCVEDICIGDLLMGPDGGPRKVIALGQGTEKAYKVIPNKGESFCCNESHILSLKVTGGGKMGGWGKGDIINVTIKDYLTRSKTFKHITKLWYAPIEFPEAQLPFDPWMVGVWIGDGCSNGGNRITKPDQVIQSEIALWAESIGATWSLTKDNTENDTICIQSNEHGYHKVTNPLKKIAILCTHPEKKCKYIPLEYLRASRKQRLELLAGLIDTDGYSNNGLGYEIATKYETLADGIMQLCRGLGFRCTRRLVQKGIKSLNFVGWYWRIQISGDLTQIPCRGHKKITSMKNRVDPTMTGFTLEDIGEQKYYGFELEGTDKLFLLWDHLVTHNTTLLVNYLRAYSTMTSCVIAPGVDLVKQLYDDITGKFGLPGRRVHLVHGAKNIKGPVLPGDVVVCSADSLGKLDSTQYDLMLADEPHELVTNERITAIDAFTKARRIGFGATLTGRFDGRDKLIEGLFGPVIVERTYKEAVEEGAICPLNVLFLDIELTPRNYFNRLRAYDGLFFKNQEMCNLIKRICDEVVPADFQTLIFIKHEKQADLLQDTIGRDTCVAMAKKLTMKERDEVTAKLKSNTIKRCLCSKIYVKGVTFSDVRVLINAEAGGNNTSSIQKPGRLAEIRPGKKCGIIIDFFFKEAPGYEGVDAKGAWRSLIADSRNRKKAYSDKGYEIAHCASMEELKTKFNALI